MLHYAGVKALAESMQEGAVLLSGSSIALLLSALGESAELSANWIGSGWFGELTDEEKDVVEAWCGKAGNELMVNALTGVMYLGTSQKPGSLPCDGTIYQKADYPALYEFYQGTVFQVDENSFRVPDLSDKFPLIVGDDTTIGDVGGEKNHTLTVGEIPTHSHSESVAISTVIAAGLEAVQSAAITGVGQTGNSGLGQSHNNMPPYFVLGVYVWI